MVKDGLALVYAAARGTQELRTLLRELSPQIARVHATAHILLPFIMHSSDTEESINKRCIS
jgi:hypothetical protein